MTRFISVAIALFMAAFLFGCADPGIHEGTVIDKSVEGAYDTTSRYCVMSVNVSNGTISSGYGGYGMGGGTSICTLWDETTTHHPETYWLELQDCSEHPEIPTTTQIKYDECKHGRVDVDITIYSNAVIGRPYPLLTGDR